MTPSPSPVLPDFPEDLRRLRVVLCHDWLTGMRGGERVLSVLCELYPEAPLFTLIHNRSAIAPEINQHPITTSFLQKIPGIRSHYRNWLPAFPIAIDRFRPPDCDLIISTSHCVAKALRPPPGARHLCYCFTPMRYAWTFHEEYFGKNPLKRLALSPLLAMLRIWDRQTAQRVTHFTAISRHIQDRILRFYGRSSDVVYPPVETERWTPSPKAGREGFDLIVSALVPYKRIDLAVEAYTRLQRPLKIIGVGGEFDRLRQKAGPTIELLGWQPDEIILDLYRRCDALVFPGEEDFGIVPLEAQACGKPVIAFGRGGALETVADGVSGIFFSEQTIPALVEAVHKSQAQSWDPAAIRQHAERFGRPAFLQGLARSVRACLAASRA